MKLKYMIPALCICTCTAMPEMLHAQDDSLKKDSTGGLSMQWTMYCRNGISRREEK